MGLWPFDVGQYNNVLSHVHLGISHLVVSINRKWTDLRALFRFLLIKHINRFQIIRAFVFIISEYVLYICAFANAPLVLWNVYRSYADKTGKMRNCLECIRPLIPLTIFFCISALWVHYSPNDIVYNHPRAVYLLTGTIFSNISCRLIVSQMSDTKCETVNWITPYMAIACCISIFIPRLEIFMLYSMLVMSSLTHWHYGTVVVQQLCEHFNRICFGVTMRTKVQE